MHSGTLPPQGVTPVTRKIHPTDFGQKEARRFFRIKKKPVYISATFLLHGAVLHLIQQTVTGITYQHEKSKFSAMLPTTL